MESLGLSTVHISPHEFIHGVSVASECHVDVYSGGQLMELSIEKQANSLKLAEREKRGRVESFSKASRRRLLRKVSKINKNEVDPPLFITLTYPMFFPSSSETYKGHLDDFCKRFARRFPNGFLFWKLEFQRRGAPHYHLMVLGVDSVDKGWLSQAWYEVVGSGDEKHLRAGTQVQRSNGWKAVLGYCAKYMGKIPKVDEEAVDVQVEKKEIDGEVWVNYSSDVTYVGRFWGLRNITAYYSTLTQERYTVSFGAFCRAKRTLRRYVESQLRLPKKNGQQGRRRKLFRRAREGCAAFISDVGARRILEHVLSHETDPEPMKDISGWQPAN